MNKQAPIRDENLIPNKLLASLAVLPANTAVAGLMRHAERYPIPAGDFGNQIRLTENGIASCQLLADKLKQRLTCLFSSPVKRCLQTAELLASAAKFPLIQHNQLLGDPGIFITDRHQAHFYCLKHQPFTLVQRLLNDEPNPAGFCQATDKTVFNLINALLSELSGAGLNLFITHDSILSVALGILFNELTVEELWPDYLESMFFWQQQEFLHIIYRDKYKRILWTN